MTHLSKTEREELDSLRKCALKWIKDPLERIFFELESILDNAHSQRVDAVMPTHAFRVLAKAVILLKQEMEKK